MEGYSLPIDFTEPDLAPIPAFSIAESVQTGKSLFALGGFATNRDTGKQHWVQIRVHCGHASTGKERDLHSR